MLRSVAGRKCRQAGHSGLPGAAGTEGRQEGGCGPHGPSPQDHSQNPVGVACTMAHEMGHNLGMDHDDNIQGCYCPEARDRGGCVMAAHIG